jgi:hypothetical protein
MAVHSHTELWEGRRDGLIRYSRFDTGASFITCTHGSSSYWNPAHGKHKGSEAQLYIRCVSIRISPVGYRHLVKDQKDAEPTIEDKPAHDAPCAMRHARMAAERTTTGLENQGK